MCRVSDKLILCTCPGDYNALRHYWTFHRFIKDKNVLTVGIYMLPYPLSEENHEDNYATLLKLLNEGNPFDVDLQPLKKDRLCITFSCGEHNEAVHYGFGYTGKKWKREDYDWHEWYWHHEEVQGGKIKNALLRTEGLKAAHKPSHSDTFVPGAGPNPERT